MYLDNSKRTHSPLLIILVLDIHVPEGGQSIRISYFCAIVEAGATIYTYLAFFESNIVGAYLTQYILLFLIFVVFVPTS